MKWRFAPCVAAIVLLLYTNAFSFCFKEAGDTFGVSPTLLEGIARTESGMNPRAINHNVNGSTDYGLMQINSLWLKDLKISSAELLENPCLNAKIGARILRDCIDRYSYGWMAVGCYNATAQGKRARYAWKVFNLLKKGESAPEKGGKDTEGETTAFVSSSTLLYEVTDVKDDP